ncbi:MAG TPA: hypothetical protein VFT55_03480, partial [Planctomycetota bacterium]|nr:hypothetical protein [Planctomycetota bacterium]
RSEEWLLRDDDERLADLGGWRTTADARGCARVALAGTTTVIAEHDGRFGELLLRAHAATPAGGHRIELDADREVRVQVVDDGGAPCGGVIVLLHGHSDGSRVARTRDPDGIATFRHLQRLDSAAPARVRTEVLGHDDPGTTFSAATPPVEPIVLRLPPCGSVRAVAEFAGRPVGGEREIVFSYLRRYTHFTAPVLVGPDGYAHLRHVALGLDLSAGSFFGHVSFAGPREAGQRVDVRIEPVPEHTTWTGRLLAHDRTAVAGQEFSVLLDDGQRPRRHYAWTDADGRFVVTVWENLAGRRAKRLWFDWPPSGEARTRAELAPRMLQSGVEDLGDVVATTPELVAGGCITGLDARSLRRVTLRVERHEPVASEPEQWADVDDLLIDRRPDGAFAIRGTAAAGRHRLVVGGDAPPVAPIEFALGREDLMIELDAGHDLAAGVLLPRDVPPELIVVELVPPPSMQVEPLRRVRLAALPLPQHGERHDVRWTALAAGIYTLELRPWAATAPVLRVPDVRVPPPAGGDARLVDIDLRSLLRATTIDVVDAGGAISQGNGVVFPEPRPRTGPWLGYEIRSGTGTAVVPAGPCDAFVCYPERRPQLVRGGASDRLAVRLDPWPTVRVSFPDAPPAPDHIAFYVRAVPVAAVDGRFATRERSGDLVDLLEPGRSWGRIDDGFAEACVGDGGSRLEVQVYRFGPEQREQVIPVHEPRMVLPTTTHAVARVPP